MQGEGSREGAKTRRKRRRAEKKAGMIKMILIATGPGAGRDLAPLRVHPSRLICSVFMSAFSSRLRVFARRPPQLDRPQKTQRNARRKRGREPLMAADEEAERRSWGREPRTLAHGSSHLGSRHLLLS